ncbi:hypothetical protein [Daejeonia sp. YH14]|uniref:hypothetical protein n=1 Tax=Daejeonia sp. YH14 TaxID=3439042 RepID=UPI003F495418
MKNHHHHLIGKSKKDIIDSYGHEFNYYPASIWTYEIGRNWMGKRKILIIVFENEIVKTIRIKYCYGKLNSNKL